MVQQSMGWALTDSSYLTPGTNHVTWSRLINATNQLTKPTSLHLLDGVQGDQRKMVRPLYITKIIGKLKGQFSIHMLFTM